MNWLRQWKQAWDESKTAGEFFGGMAVWALFVTVGMLSAVNSWFCKLFHKED